LYPAGAPLAGPVEYTAGEVNDRTDSAALLPRGIRELVNELAKMPSLERIVLFGSRARGDGGPRSDVDLAVVAPMATVAEWQAMVDSAEACDSLLQVDLVRLEEASQEFRERILAEGKVLFARRARIAKSAYSPFSDRPAWRSS